MWASHAADNVARIHPLPVSELSRIVANWLDEAGYTVKRTEPYPGRIDLTAEKQGELWQLTVSPHSVLASELLIDNLGSIENQAPMPNQLDAFLDAYTSESADVETTGEKNFPAPVLRNLQAVVCIQARLKNKDAQQSGFLIENQGLVLSTIHDLETIRSVRVVTHDGRRLAGQVVRLDSHNDLALIQTDFAQNRYVHVRDGLNQLRRGDRVYSIGCPRNQIGEIYAGIVIGSPRRVEDRTFWQVNMEIYPGSSGSPVFDAQGRLVGMVKGRYRGTDSIGFIIPFEVILSFLKTQ
jgi:serine protease Do